MTLQNESIPLISVGYFHSEVVNITEVILCDQYRNNRREVRIMNTNIYK